MPTVSVVLPTQNRAEMLKRAVESVLAQTYQDLELVIVDDGSTDDTDEVIASFQDPRIRVLRHQKARGASAARNTGIAHSNGELIAFLDDDDEWLPTKLEKQEPVLMQAPKTVGLVYCWMDYFKGDKLIREHHPELRGHVFSQVLDRQRLGGCPTLLVRRQVVDDVGGFDESLPRGNDGDFIRRVCRKYRVDFVPEVLVRVQVGHSERISSNCEQSLRNRIKGGETKLCKFADDLKRFPQAHANILHDLAQTHQQLGAYRKAETYLCQAIGKSPRDFRLYRALLCVIGRAIGGRSKNVLRVSYNLLPSPLRDSVRRMRQEYRYVRGVRIIVLKRHLRETWAALNPVKLPNTTEKSRVVYVTGMPRTGTSLAKNYLGTYPGLTVIKFQRYGFVHAWQVAKQSDTIVLDKATHYIRSVRKIYRAYGKHIAFCCLVRDPRDELVSLLETNKHREIFRDERFWRQWAHTYKTFLEFAESLADPRVCYLIRYEDLVRWPVPAKVGFLTWLGLNVDLTTITPDYSVVHADDIQDWKVQERRSVRAESVGRWKEVSVPEIQSLLCRWQNMAEVASIMEAFGYTDEGTILRTLKFVGLTVFQPNSRNIIDEQKGT